MFHARPEIADALATECSGSSSWLVSSGSFVHVDVSRAPNTQRVEVVAVPLSVESVPLPPPLRGRRCMFLPLYQPIYTPDSKTAMNFTTLRPPPPSQAQRVTKEGAEKDAEVRHSFRHAAFN